MQNYRSKSETAIIIVAGCLKYCRFQFFSPFQSSHFGFLFCVRRFVGFFLLFVGVLRRFNTGKHVQRQKNTKLAHRQKNMSPAIIPEKSNNFTYIGRCRCVYIYIYILSNLENPRFTERTSTNLGRSHRLPHVCTIMIYAKLGGHCLQETFTFIYIYI